jgi:hypothetical protein
VKKEEEEGEKISVHGDKVEEGAKIPQIMLERTKSHVVSSSLDG